MGRINSDECRRRCNINGIRIYPKPLERGPRPDCVLVVEIKGWTQVGEIIYKQTLKGQEEIARKMEDLYWHLYFDYKHKFLKNCDWDYKTNSYIST